jgi:glutathione S-transferase
MKLYGSRTSPYVRKARVLIRETSMQCEFVREDPEKLGIDEAANGARCSPIPP